MEIVSSRNLTDVYIVALTDDLVGIGSERAEKAVRRAPHFLQNRAPGLTGALQAGTD
jgi:hypothetical protein